MVAVQGRVIILALVDVRDLVMVAVKVVVMVVVLVAQEIAMVHAVTHVQEVLQFAITKW